MEATRFAAFMTPLEGLTEAQRQAARERLAVLDDQADRERLIRERLGQPVRCPHCAGTEAARFGQVRGRQRYRCKGCGRTFVALTGTPFLKLRDLDKLLAYARCMSQGLTGVIEAGDGLFPRSYKGQRTGLPVPRAGMAGVARPVPGRRTSMSRPPPDEPPVPVGVAMRRGTRQTRAAVLPTREANAFTTALQAALATDAVLSTDGPTGGIVARTLGIETGYHGPEGIGVWHVQNINADHSRLKAWMARFHGVAATYRHHDLGWRRLLDRHQDTVKGQRFLFHALR